MIEITCEQMDYVRKMLDNVPGGVEKATASAINRTESAVISETQSQIKKTYIIRRFDIRGDSTIRVRKAAPDSGNIVGVISFSGYKLPLFRFDVSPSIAPSRETVEAHKRKDTTKAAFENAFIAKMKSGHVGMLERTTSTRTPITEFMGDSVATMASDSDVNEAVRKKAQETVGKRLEHEIDRILKGYGG